MTYPIPGVGISTPYGKRGSMWSCNKNSSGQGIHTGVDFAAGSGTNIYAPISGQIRHRSYGSAFGSHQFAISPDPGQPFGEGEVFFAHTTNRPADGIYVSVGDYVADVGAEGNVSGPHLHFEYHPHSKNSWSCSVIADPQPVLDYQGAAPPQPETPETPETPKEDDLTPEQDMLLREVYNFCYSYRTKNEDSPSQIGPAALGVWLEDTRVIVGQLSDRLTSIEAKLE